MTRALYRLLLPILGCLFVIAGEAQAQKHLAVADLDFFRKRIGECWKVPEVGKYPAATNVEIGIKLKLDGTLDGPPSVSKPLQDDKALALSKEAIDAVYRCQPYKLSADTYELWKELVIRFSASPF
jgi:colicin import membrane protein